MDPALSPPFTGARHQRNPRYGPVSERSLGFGRVCAAVGILILAGLDFRSPGLLRNHTFISAVAFAAYSLLVLLVLRKHRQWPESFRKVLHRLDIISVVLVAFLLHRSEAALFLLFLFALVAAAQRWGSRQVLWTAGAFAILLMGELLLVVSWKSGGASQQGAQPDANLISVAGFVVFAAGLLWQFSRTVEAQRSEASARAAQRVRADVSREIHDSAMQSLFSVEYRLEKLKSGNFVLPREASDELAQLQLLVQRSSVELRQIVQQGRPFDLGRKSFVQYVADLTAEFEAETGIGVRFVFDNGQIPPPAVAIELVRIVQEALVNVKKHSGARNVSIGFSATHGRWKLRIDDDGRGFDFAGRLCMLELEANSQGPYVIRERVSTLGGELEVESKPGQGACLEIAFPKDALG